MERIDILLGYLRAHHWHMTSFPFNYKHIDYVVLFEDLKNLSLVNEGYDVFLTFVDCDNEDRRLSVKANSYHFKFNVREFREFFGIEYTKNLGDIFQQFYEYFNSFIPTEIIARSTDQERRLVIECLNNNDNDNNTCCYKLMRNPIVDGKQHYRTPFNDQKARMLKADLYTHFENEHTISFCFREKNELSTMEIMRNFASQEARKLR